MEGHKRDVDHSGSLGILVQPLKPCLVHCFACKFKARSLEALFRNLHYMDPSKGFDEMALAAKDIEEASLRALLDAAPEFRGLRGTRLEYEVLPPETYDQYANMYHPYLADRGIKVGLARRWEAGWDDERKRVVFPVRDCIGQLVGIVGRTVVGDPQKYYNYWFDKSKFLFGEQFTHPGKPLVLVEGILSAVVLSSAVKSHAVVAAMGSEMSSTQLRRIVTMSDEITVVFDNDSAGRKGSTAVCDALWRKVKTRVVSWEGAEEGADPANTPDIADRVLSAKLY